MQKDNNTTDPSTTPPPGFAEDPVNDTFDNQTSSDTKSNGDVSENPLINKTIFENRRKMAWVSLIAILVITAVLLILLMVIFGMHFYNPDLVASFTDSYEKYLKWVSEFFVLSYIALTTVVVSYMGFTTMAWNNFLRRK